MKSDSTDSHDIKKSRTVSDPDTGQEPLIGKCIDERYEVQSVISRGAMGKIYLARQQPLGRLCALKVLDPVEECEDPSFAERFLLEASTAAKLTSGNTVTIYDYGQDGDVYYIAMEYVVGRPLSALLRQQGPLSQRRAASLLYGICRSLNEAHRLGVIHRDIKPANVMLVEGNANEERVKVLDFGLVKILRDDSLDLTQRGMLMGSPRTMAPEQLTGEQTSPQTDIYALGVIAYEMLTGVSPFARQGWFDTLMAHLQDAPPPMEQYDPVGRISPAMKELIYRCLAKDPQQRVGSIAEFCEALRSICGEGSASDAYEPRAPLSSSPVGLQYSAADEPTFVLERDEYSIFEHLDEAIVPTGSDSVWQVEQPSTATKDRPRKNRWAVAIAAVAIVAMGIVGLSARYTRIAQQPVGTLEAKPGAATLAAQQLRLPVCP